MQESFCLKVETSATQEPRSLRKLADQIQDQLPKPSDLRPLRRCAPPFEHPETPMAKPILQKGPRVSLFGELESNWSGLINCENELFLMFIKDQKAFL